MPKSWIAISGQDQCIVHNYLEVKRKLVTEKQINVFISYSKWCLLGEPLGLWFSVDERRYYKKKTPKIQEDGSIAFISYTHLSQGYIFFFKLLMISVGRLLKDELML